MEYDITLIGNYTKDKIVTPKETKYIDGGGFNYGAHAAIALGAKTAAITRLKKNDIHVINNLVSAGIDAFPTYTNDSTHMELIYPTDDFDDRVLVMPKSAGSFTSDQFENIKSKVFLVNASIRDEFKVETLVDLKKKGSLIGIDLQGFIRTIDKNSVLINSNWKEKKEALGLTHYLKADGVEAEFLTGESDLISAAKILKSYGPKEVIITHKDGVLVYDGENIYQEPFILDEIIGRSGRGDTCGASYVYKRLTLNAKNSIKWAAAATSLKMESDTPLKNTIHEIENRVSKYK
jgi:sugar/nucleoside kinase (ribokinase family)